MTEKIYINNENFIHMIKSMKSDHFGLIPEYIVLFDKLNKEHKQILEDTEIPKNHLIILAKDAKKVPKKFKHQIQVQKLFEEPDIRTTLKHIFKIGNREQIRKELDDFENRYLLTWLESTSAYYPDVAIKMADMDKYVYSPYFKDMLLYNLENMLATPQFFRRNEINQE